MSIHIHTGLPKHNDDENAMVSMKMRLNHHRSTPAERIQLSLTWPCHSTQYCPQLLYNRANPNHIPFSGRSSIIHALIRSAADSRHDLQGRYHEPNLKIWSTHSGSDTATSSSPGIRFIWTLFSLVLRAVVVSGSELHPSIIRRHFLGTLG